MKKIIIVTLAALSICQSAFALTVYDPTNHTENLATKLQMIEQVKNSAQQLQNDIKNLQKLDPSNLDYNYNRISAVIRKMENIREQTNAIGTEFDGLMAEWDENNPDYEEWNGIDAEKYAEQTDKLRDKWGKTLLQALGMTGIASPSEQMETQEAMNRLLEASQNAEGAMGALQAANQMTALMINEQQKMQAIMAEATRSQSMYYQMLLDRENQIKATNKKFAGEAEDNVVVRGNGKNMAHF
jgi:P-type conjugative transfer protein TrbJ